MLGVSFPVPKICFCLVRHQDFCCFGEGKRLNQVNTVSGAYGNETWHFLAGNRIQLCSKNAFIRVPENMSRSESDWRVCDNLLY